MQRVEGTTVLLYASAVLVWGTTWINMKYQLGEVAPAASLTYRYLAAGLIVLAGAALAGKTILMGARAHLWCVGQGALMFSVNYWLTYLAAAHLTTGIIAVMFAGASAVTMILIAVTTWTRPPARALFGAVLGMGGIACVFYPEIARLRLDGPEVQSGAIVSASVILFAIGGLVGARNMRAGQPRFATIGWAMLYGGLIMAALTLARGESFEWTWRPSYLWSLAWLTLLGSVAFFLLYFAVVARVGAEKASYGTVLFPLVALAVSTVLEGYDWPMLAFVGVPLALLGNALVLSSGPALPATPPSARGEA